MPVLSTLEGGAPQDFDGLAASTAAALDLKGVDATLKTVEALATLWRCQLLEVAS